MNTYPFIKSADTKAQITEKGIMKLESKYSIVFPKDLKEFYLAYNGCETIPCYFQPSEDTLLEECFIIQEFAYIQGENIDLPKQVFTMERLFEYTVEADYLPYTLIPFATDEGADSFYCDPKTNKIWVYHGEFVDSPILLADNFDEFLKKIKVGNLYDLI